MQVSRQFLQVSVTFILARLLGPEEIGLIAMVFVFIGFAQIISESGFGSALIQKQDINETHINTIFYVNIITGIILTLLIFSAAPFIAAIYEKPELRSITQVLSIGFFISSFGIIQVTLLIKKMDFAKIAKVNITAVGISGIIAVIMAMLGYGVWSLAAQFLVMAFVNVILLWFSPDWKPRLLFSINALKEVLGFSSNLMGFNAINYLSRNLDKFLIGKYLGSNQLGIYGWAYRLMLIPLTEISWTVTQVMFSALSSIQDDKARVKQIYLRATRTIALITFPLMAGLFVVADSFILTLLNEDWIDVIPVLKIFCFVGLGQSIGATFGWIYQSQGRANLQFRMGIIFSAVFFISFIIGLKWGVIGVATAYTIAWWFIFLYPAQRVSGGLIGLRFFELLKNLSGAFGCSILMGFIVYSTRFVLPENWNHGQILAVQVSTGIAVYYILINIFRLNSYIEVKQIIKEQFNQ